MLALLHYIPTVALFILVLAVLVLVHEFGHFVAARLFKIDVEEFGIGFPPRATSWKRGKTLWSLNWIPLGGFVRIRGEEKHDPKDHHAFGNKPAYVRSIVIVAGVAMNLLLASLLFSAGFMMGVPQIAEDLPKNAHPRELDVQIMEALPGFPAEAAGLRVGDVLLSLDGHPYTTVTEIQDYVNTAGDKSIQVEARRGKKHLVVDIAPKLKPDTNRYILGVALIETAIVAYSPPVAIAKGFAATGYYVKEIVVSVFDLVKSLFTEQKSGAEFSGPVGIAVLTGRVAKLGLTYLLQFVAILSVNLAVVNVLPIPALDGGRLMFIILARLRGHEIRPKIEAAMHRIAFFLLLGLVLIVTANDLAKYRDQILQALKAVFGVS